MARTIASLHAQIGASAAGFNAAMDTIAQKAKAAERTVTGTKMKATVDVNTAKVTQAQQQVQAAAGKINSTRATVNVTANTAPATAQLAQLEARARQVATAGAIGAAAGAGPAATAAAAGGPVAGLVAGGLGVLGRAVNNIKATVMASIGRLVSQTEEGKKFVQATDRVVGAVVIPWLRILTPAIESLTPVAQRLGSVIAQVGVLVQQSVVALQRAAESIRQSLPRPSGAPQAQTWAGTAAQLFGGATAAGAGLGVLADILTTTQTPVQGATPITPAGASATAAAQRQQTIFDDLARSIQTLADEIRSMAANRPELEAAQRQEELQRQLAEHLRPLQFLQQGLMGQANLLQANPGLEAITNVFGFNAAGIATQAEKLQQQMWLITQTAQEEFQLQEQKRRSLESQLSVLRRQERLMGEGASLMESVRSPLETLEHELARIERLQQAGAIGADTAALAMARAIGTAQAAVPQVSQQSVAALEAGTAAGASAVLAAQRAQRGAQNPNQGVENLLAQLRDMQAAQLRAAEELVREFRGLDLPAPRELR